MSPAPFRLRRALAAVLTLAAAAAACQPNQGAAPSATGSPGPVGSGAACATAPSVPDDLAGWQPPTTAPTVYPTIIAVPGQLACGPTRFLFTFTDADLRPVGSPDRTVKLDLFNLGRDPEKAIASVDGTFVWAIEDERGIYYANVEFPEAGRYGAQFTTAEGGAAPETLRLTFDVQPTSPAVRVGDPAPSSTTPTLASVGGDISHVSTDPEPEPRLYEKSLDAALTAHEPIALIFATPKFCTSAQCGPTLDRIKAVADKAPDDVAFINVEPYQLAYTEGRLQPVLDANGQLQPVEAVDEWGILTEPWVFTVDGRGKVQGSFEGVIGEDELTAAIQAISGS